MTSVTQPFMGQIGEFQNFEFDKVIEAPPGEGFENDIYIS